MYLRWTIYVPCGMVPMTAMSSTGPVTCCAVLMTPPVSEGRATRTAEPAGSGGMPAGERRAMDQDLRGHKPGPVRGDGPPAVVPASRLTQPVQAGCRHDGWRAITTHWAWLVPSQVGLTYATRDQMGVDVGG